MDAPHLFVPITVLITTLFSASPVPQEECGPPKLRSSVEEVTSNLMTGAAVSAGLTWGAEEMQVVFQEGGSGVQSTSRFCRVDLVIEGDNHPDSIAGSFRYSLNHEPAGDSSSAITIDMSSLHGAISSAVIKMDKNLEDEPSIAEVER